MTENSPAFERRDWGQTVTSPEGTAEIPRCLSRPVRDLDLANAEPSVKTLGYSRLSRRDKDVHLGCSNHLPVKS